MDEVGQRIPPLYRHHVDDNYYADIRPHFKRTVASSILALYVVLGFPAPVFPDPLSREKLETSYSHTRRIAGRFVDTPSLTVGMLPYKRDQLLETLRSFLSEPTFLLGDTAALLGTLENHTRFCAWVRPWFWAIQNAARRALQNEFYRAKRRYYHTTAKAKLQAELPSSMWNRISSIISKEHASLIWRTKRRTELTEEATYACRFILSYLEKESDPWRVSLGFIIPRDPHVVTLGDARKSGWCLLCRAPVLFYYPLVCTGT